MGDLVGGQGAAYLRVPSKRVAMVSRKVFCGARSPFITGMTMTQERVEVVHCPPAAHTITGGVTRGSER